MTQAERDVIDAARAAVHVDTTGRVIVGDMVRDSEKLGALVRAVMRLNSERVASAYWR
jgi:hypothetical protein